MNGIKKSAIQRVRQALEEKGSACNILELSESTGTAEEAAITIGCAVSEIAKSLVFQATESGEPVLIITSGINRVDTGKVSKLLGEPIVKANADYIRKETGFVIGGIPPVGHPRSIKTFIDEDLLNYETIWAAAGTPFSVFSIKADSLEELTGGTVATVKE